MSAPDAAERAEEGTAHRPSERTPKKRMLVIVNPYATTVFDKRKTVAVAALQSRYAAEAVETEGPDHATHLSREAVSEGYEVVVVFGGDGTMNEAANGMVGSDIPLTCLPGGSANVYCRTFGIPVDLTDALEQLLRLADDFRPRRIDLGRVNGRYFGLSSGLGLDARVVERVDANPRMKTRFRQWFFAYTALAAFAGYLVRPVRVRVEAGGRSLEGIAVIVQNASAYTYLGPRPLRISGGAGLETGSLSLASLKRATLLGPPTLLPLLATGRSAAVIWHRQIEALQGFHHARIETLDGRSLPVQVDGDFIGDFEAVDYEIVPRALMVVT